MSGRLNRRITAALDDWRGRDRLRVRRLVVPAGPGLAAVDGRTVVNFCSNDYLGLAQDPRIAVDGGAAGAAASALVTGYGPAHAALEHALADWLERDRVLLFPSGFSANLGTLDALLGRGDIAVCDALNHASLIDGVRLSGAHKQVYAHADVADAAGRLRAAPGDDRLVALVTDAIFSMDGDHAPLPELIAAARSADALVYVDDAHGLGIDGDDGRGVAGRFDQQAVPVLVGTLGKALGAAGAFVAGPADVIAYLENRARTQVFSTALPPATVAAAHHALRLARDETWRRAQVVELVGHFHARLRAAGLPVPASKTAIQPVVIGTDAAAVAASQALLAAGYLVTAIRPPTVPEATARLRITLTAAHTTGQVDGLVDALTRVLDAPLARPADLRVA